MGLEPVWFSSSTVEVSVVVAVTFLLKITFRIYWNPLSYISAVERFVSFAALSFSALFILIADDEFQGRG